MHPTASVQREAAKSFGSLSAGLPALCEERRGPASLNKMQSLQTKAALGNNWVATSIVASLAWVVSLVAILLSRACGFCWGTAFDQIEVWHFVDFFIYPKA